MLPAGESEAALPAWKMLGALAAGTALTTAAAEVKHMPAAVAVMEQARRVLWPADAGHAARQLVASSHSLPRHTPAAAAAAAAILSAPPSPSAAALASALDRHCLGVSLAQLHASALALHIAATVSWLTVLRTTGRPPGPACQASMRHALQHCCLLLHSGGGEASGYCYRMATRLAPLAAPKPPPAAVARMLEEWLVWAKEGQCQWLRRLILCTFVPPRTPLAKLGATSVAPNFCFATRVSAGWCTAVDVCLCLAATHAKRGSPSATLPRATQLLADARGMERRLRPWLPPVTLAQLRQTREVKALGESAAPSRAMLGGSKAVATLRQFVLPCGRSVVEVQRLRVESSAGIMQRVLQDGECHFDDPCIRRGLLHRFTQRRLPRCMQSPSQTESAPAAAGARFTCASARGAAPPPTAAATASAGTGGRAATSSAALCWRPSGSGSRVVMAGAQPAVGLPPKSYGSCRFAMHSQLGQREGASVL